MTKSGLQEELNYDEAMRVLGYEPGAIVSPHLPAFREVEEKLGKLIETTRDEKLKKNFGEELTRLHEALRVVEAGKAQEPPVKRRGMAVRLVVAMVLAGCVVGSLWLVDMKINEQREIDVGRQIEALSVDGKIAVETRRWEEAEAIFSKMKELRPGSERAKAGFASIAEGKVAVRRQNIGYLVGSVQAALESRDWDLAEKSSRELLELEPENPNAAVFLSKVEEGRVFDKTVKILERADEALNDENWSELQARTAELEAMSPGHVELTRLKRASEEGMRLLAERRVKARQLYELALSLDEGSYSQEGLDALREAMRLSKEPDIEALYQKMSSYARVLEVPAEFPTISEALAAARAKDKIRIAEGTYEEALVLPVVVNLEGAGEGKTVVHCAAELASVVLIGEAASGSRVAGMTLRQTGIALADERYPVVVIEGGEVSLEDCLVDSGSGHGVAVVSGGVARLRNVRVFKCGWDGLAVYGTGSRAEVVDSRFESNLQHGIDAWDGGSVSVQTSRSTLNGLAGLVLMSPGVKSTVTSVTLDRNREVGVLISNGTVAELRSNRSEANLLGGFLIEGEGTEVVMVRNVAEKNLEVGIVVDKRSNLVLFQDNMSTGNSGEQLRLKADLPVEVILPPMPLDAPPKAQVIPEGASIRE